MSQSELQGFGLSPQQIRLWSLLQSRPAGDLACGAAVEIEGDVDAERLARALGTVVARHEILTTGFRRLPGTTLPVQVTGAAAEPSLELYPPVADEQVVSELLDSQVGLPFDLSEGPCLRAGLAPSAGRRNVLLLSLCPLCGDLKSLENLVRELAAAYAGELDRDDDEVFQYVQFAAWRSDMVEDPDEQDLRQFWAEQSAAGIASGPLPGELGGELASTGMLGSRRALSVELSSRLAAKAAAVESGSLDGLLLTAWQALLLRLSDAPEATVGELYGYREEEILEAAVGLYAGFLPVRVQRRAEQSFDELWQESEQRREAVREMAEGFVWGDLAQLEAGRVEPVQWGFEFQPEPFRVGIDGLTFALRHCRVAIDVVRLQLSVSHSGAQLVLEVRQDSNHFDTAHGEGLLDQLEVMLEAVSQSGQQTLEELPWLSPAERHRLLDQPLPAAAPESFMELLAAQFARRPQAPAVCFEEQVLSYGELDSAVESLAERLRCQGVGPEVVVAIGLQRSAELIVALLAVLRAGGAYLVLDAEQPVGRLRRMLTEVAGWQQGGRTLMITARDHVEESLQDVAQLLWLDDPAADPPAEQVAAQRALPVAGNLAYVVLTSGSTGRPKGVAVEHRHIDAYLHGAVDRLELPAAGSYATVSTFAADLGNTMLFPALASGGCLHVLSTARATNPVALAEYFDRYRVDCLKIVPSHLQALLEGDQGADLLPACRLILGGEGFPWPLADRLRELAAELRIFNHYGPSETTVGVLARELVAGDRDMHSATVPIGRRLAWARAHVLDASLRPVPVFVPGELLLGGGSVSRGYIGQPAPTAAAFVPDPFSDVPGERLYRSGDLVRRLASGEIEFLGRRDHQVKLRGFRIELGEIRAALCRHAQIRDAVVRIVDDGGRPTVLAYYVSRLLIDPGELRDLLRNEVHEAAVPKLFYRLKRLPLTLNGKLNYDALPAIEEVRRELAVKRQLVAPRNPVEQALVEIWKELLRVEELSVDDNFFELSGDSILAIQVTARANRLGYSLKPQQIFLHPTVEQLARVAAEGQRVDGDQGPVEGESPLVPIQRWFFDQQFSQPEHWNQPLMFELPEALAGDVLRSLIGRLTAHHDALRARFERRGDDVVAIYDPVDSAPPPAVVSVDLRRLAPDARPAVIETLAAQAQRSLDLHRGPLLRAVQFDLGQDGARLLLVLHHLVVDVVSWQVLAEDLATLGHGLATGGHPTLPAKTTSYRTWAERLVEYGSTAELTAELDYWRAAAQPAPADLPVDQAGGANTVGSVATVTEVLDPELTRALLQEVPSTFRSRINDALLSALARALSAWTGTEDLWIEMEGHGREDLFDDVDLTRTVGWFTSLYPVRLRLSGEAAAEPAEALAQVKEQLAAVPRRGIGYGVLRASAGGAELARQPRPQLKLNYLGQVGSGPAQQSGAGQIGQAAESAGPARSPRSVRAYLLEIDSEVLDGELRMHWRYSRTTHRRSTIEGLARDFRDRLAELAGCAGSASSVAAAASDFPLAGLDADRLDKVAAALERLGDGAAASEEG